MQLAALVLNPCLGRSGLPTCRNAASSSSFWFPAAIAVSGAAYGAAASSRAEAVRPDLERGWSPPPPPPPPGNTPLGSRRRPSPGGASGAEAVSAAETREMMPMREMPSPIFLAPSLKAAARQSREGGKAQQAGHIGMASRWGYQALEDRPGLRLSGCAGCRQGGIAANQVPSQVGSSKSASPPSSVRKHSKQLACRPPRQATRSAASAWLMHKHHSPRRAPTCLQIFITGRQVRHERFKGGVPRPHHLCSCDIQPRRCGLRGPLRRRVLSTAEEVEAQHLAQSIGAAQGMWGVWGGWREGK